MQGFWTGKKVFITGHTGFKGSWLALWLQFLNADVIGFALPAPLKPNLFTLAKVADGMTSIIGDIRDYALLQRVLNEYQPEIIIHLAAQPLVRHSYREPLETYSTNVMGTVHLLEAVRQMGKAKSVINVTTDKCYDNKEWHWGYRENDPLGGLDPYANSKACSELVTSTYRHCYFNQSLSLGLASARAGNVIGGGDWSEDRLIPDIIDACINQRPLRIRAPEALRPWQHVLDPLRGYLQLAERLYESPTDYADSWNFGPDEQDVKPVGWIADSILQLWGASTHWLLDGDHHPHEAKLLKLDCAKARSQLGWKSHWDIARGLQETVRWYQAYHSGADMQAETLAQIRGFMSELNLV